MSIGLVRTFPSHNNYHEDKEGMNIRTFIAVCLSLFVLISQAVAANEQAVIVVGTLDGTVYGLDAASGDRRWSVTTGGPLFSASHARGPDGDITLIPGLDGSIYVDIDGSGLKV